MLFLISLWGARFTHAETNDVYITSFSHTNGSINIVVTAPPNEGLALYWSSDLSEWEPLDIFVDPWTGETGRVIWVVSGEGIVNVTRNISPDTANIFFRTSLVDIPFK
jgi:hypothetical protein